MRLLFMLRVRISVYKRSSQVCILALAWILVMWTACSADMKQVSAYNCGDTAVVSDCPPGNLWMCVDCVPSFMNIYRYANKTIPTSMIRMHIIRLRPSLIMFCNWSNINWCRSELYKYGSRTIYTVHEYMVHFAICKHVDAPVDTKRHLLNVWIYTNVYVQFSILLRAVYGEYCQMIYDYPW